MSVEQIIDNLNKKMKIGNIQVGVEYQDLEKIPFSSYRLNYMTYGGIPIGRIAEFSGADGSGKTTTALDLAGQAQKMFPDKKVLLCDIEHTFDTEWATKLGVDVEKIIYFDPDSMGAEEVFNALIEIIKSGDVSLAILDSIGAMVSMQANEKEIGERTYGGISMSLTEFAKKITPILARTKTAFIGINQVRDDMNSMYGGTTTTGGRAWRHSCTTRLSFRKGNYVDEKGNKLSRSCENPVGNLVNVSLDKSKVCPPDRKVGFYTLNYINGVDFISDLFDVAVYQGIVQQGGAWYSLIDIETGEVMTDNNEPIKIQGRGKFIDTLKEDKNMFEYVENALKNIDKKSSKKL